jgi:hypothetical protein
MNVQLKTGTHTIVSRVTLPTSKVTYYKVAYDGFTAPLARWFPLAALVAVGNDEAALTAWHPEITVVPVSAAPASVKVAA